MTRPAFVREGFSGQLTDFAFVPSGTAGRLTNRLSGGETGLDVLCSSWEVAFANGLVVDDGEMVSFPVWADASARESAVLDGSALVANIKPNNNEDATLKWAVTYAGPDTRHILNALTDDVSTPRRIEDFAYVPWQTVLPEVAAKALDEPWGFQEGDMTVLRSYLTYTYQRVALQGKVAIDSKRGVAAFNTGLVNSIYDTLYLCFVPNNRPHPEWRYAGICTAGERGLGKQLVDAFAPLPERASYFEDVDDLVFDNAQELYADTYHIVVDNVDRFPRPYLREMVYDKPELVEELDSIPEHCGRQAFNGLRAAIEGDAMLLRRFKNRLDDAVDLARKRTQWNYRTAVPCYFPTANEMSLLLPLCMRDPKVPDVALVVSLTESGSYQGETILTMRQAYLDARLICRPENDWLVPV